MKLSLLLEQIKLRRELDLSLSNGSLNVDFTANSAFGQILNSSKPLVIVSQRGYSLGALLSLSKYRNVVTVVRTVSEDYKKVFDRYGIVCLSSNSKPITLVRQLYHYAQSDYLTVLHGDAPISDLTNSRKLTFLGYEVHCSELPSMLINRFDFQPYFLDQVSLSKCHASYRFLSLEHCRDFTSDILNLIQELVLQDWFSYQWNSGSFVFSDKKCVSIAALVIEEILSWGKANFKEFESNIFDPFSSYR